VCVKMRRTQLEHISSGLPPIADMRTAALAVVQRRGTRTRALLDARAVQGVHLVIYRRSPPFSYGRTPTGSYKHCTSFVGTNDHGGPSAQMPPLRSCAVSWAFEVRLVGYAVCQFRRASAEQGLCNVTVLDEADGFWRHRDARAMLATNLTIGVLILISSYVPALDCAQHSVASASADRPCSA
jgi:hypothetical protein